ncbi:MAG TPA: hypothetical protein VMZ52_10670 [Bryobacteraceae bacterium]|nr:hypothetical protein [Bryobacteraceae bacterium]
MPQIVFVAWVPGLAEVVIQTIKKDFILRPLPVIVLAPYSTSMHEINFIYSLSANAVVQEDGPSRVSEETLRRITDFWLRTSLRPGF